MKNKSQLLLQQQVFGQYEVKQKLPFTVVQAPFRKFNKYERDGHWNEKERLKYTVFLCFFQELLQNPERKKNARIYEMMSDMIITRNPSQCRSHHQKMEKFWFSIPDIIASVTKRYEPTLFRQIQEKYMASIKALLENAEKYIRASATTNLEYSKSKPISTQSPRYYMSELSYIVPNSDLAIVKDEQKASFGQRQPNNEHKKQLRTKQERPKEESALKIKQKKQISEYTLKEEAYPCTYKTAQYFPLNNSNQLKNCSEDYLPIESISQPPDMKKAINEAEQGINQPCKKEDPQKKTQDSYDDKDSSKKDEEEKPFQFSFFPLYGGQKMGKKHEFLPKDEANMHIENQVEKINQFHQEFNPSGSIISFPIPNGLPFNFALTPQYCTQQLEEARKSKENYIQSANQFAALWKMCLQNIKGCDQNINFYEQALKQLKKS